MPPSVLTVNSWGKAALPLPKYTPGDVKFALSTTVALAAVGVPIIARAAAEKILPASSLVFTLAPFHFNLQKRARYFLMSTRHQAVNNFGV
jgi:hypothetical protein